MKKIIVEEPLAEWDGPKKSEGRRLEISLDKREGFNQSEPGDTKISQHAPSTVVTLQWSSFQLQ